MFDIVGKTLVLKSNFYYDAILEKLSHEYKRYFLEEGMDCNAFIIQPVPVYKWDWRNGVVDREGIGAVKLEALAIARGLTLASKANNQFAFNAIIVHPETPQEFQADLRNALNAEQLMHVEVKAVEDEEFSKLWLLEDTKCLEIDDLFSTSANCEVEWKNDLQEEFKEFFLKKCKQYNIDTIVFSCENFRESLITYLTGGLAMAIENGANISNIMFELPNVDIYLSCLREDLGDELNGIVVTTRPISLLDSCIKYIAKNHGIFSADDEWQRLRVDLQEKVTNHKKLFL